MMQIFTEADSSIEILKSKNILVIGYGSQGAAHAKNLHDSGLRVRVALREGSSTAATVRNDGLISTSISEGVNWADVIAILTPDETQAELYSKSIATQAKPNTTLVFAHGFNINFNKIIPRSDFDVVLVGPAAPGKLVRDLYKKNLGSLAFVAVHQDSSAQALSKAKAYGAALGCARSGLLLTTFREETETDLFCEQVVLCGGLSALVRNAYDVLVEAGYPEEMVYVSCVHEVKQIADLIYTQGVSGMRSLISNTAKYGDLTRGNRIIGNESRREMKNILEDVRSGAFANELYENLGGDSKRLPELMELQAKHASEIVGARIRALMPWLARY